MTRRTLAMSFGWSDIGGSLERSTFADPSLSSSDTR
jgi:hypothetical protein